MNNALEFYEDDAKIWSISGYSFPMRALKNMNMIFIMLDEAQVGDGLRGKIDGVL